MSGWRFISRGIVFHLFIDQLLNSSGARSICLYSESKRLLSITEENSGHTCSVFAGQLFMEVTSESALLFLLSEPASSCASSRLNDTFSTARRLRAASDWVSKVAIVVLFPATQVTLSPGVKVKPSLDSSLQVISPVTRRLPPVVR